MTYYYIEKYLRGLGKRLKSDNKGMGVIEVILIIVVLISLVIIFKSQLTALVTKILGNISKTALSV